MSDIHKTEQRIEYVHLFIYSNFELLIIHKNISNHRKRNNWSHFKCATVSHLVCPVLLPTFYFLFFLQIFYILAVQTHYRSLFLRLCTDVVVGQVRSIWLLWPASGLCRRCREGRSGTCTVLRTWGGRHWNCQGCRSESKALAAPASAHAGECWGMEGVRVQGVHLQVCAHHHHHYHRLHHWNTPLLVLSKNTILKNQ